MGAFFGLDIGTSQVKLLQVDKSNQGLVLKHVAIAKIEEEEPLSAIAKCVKTAGVKYSSEVNLALAEKDVYTRIVTTPLLSETELASSIRYEAEQYVPIPLDQVELYHQILSKDTESDKKTMQVLLIAVPKDKITKITSFLDQTGLIPRSLETELFALKRALSDENKFQLLLLISHKSVDLMVVRHGMPLFMHSVASGGHALTRALMNDLALSEIQAEQYKTTYGIRTDLLEGKVATILTPLVNDWIDQVNKAYIYLQEQGHKKLPEQVVLAGGGALLPGLSSYLVKKLNTEVIIGDPFKRFVRDEKFKKQIAYEANPHLSTVVGLAIKGLV